MTRTNDYVVRSVVTMKVEGKRGKGRPRRKWMDRFKNDSGEKGLSGEEVQDRVFLEKTHQKRRPHADEKRPKERTKYFS